MHRTGILLNVDDTEALRYAKTRILRQAGFEVREAGTGSEALDLVGEINPALVLLDVKLPDISGIEVCRRIKVSHPGVSVLQMSATFVTGEFKAAALDQGADSYLVEPVEPIVLVAAVRSLLRLRQSEAKLRQSEEFSRSVLEASVDCIMVVDPGGNLEYVNPNGLKLLGASSSGSAPRVPLVLFMVQKRLARRRARLSRGSPRQDASSSTPKCNCDGRRELLGCHHQPGTEPKGIDQPARGDRPGHYRATAGERRRQPARGHR